MNKIFYNNIDVFSGICYTPFVSYQLETDGYISAKENIVLEGEIVSDCISGFSGIIQKQKSLINNFKNNYSTLVIKENSQTIYSCDNAVIKSIDFDESDYAYILPFSIEVECYEKNFFSGQYGVTNLENSFQIEEEDQSVVITHNVSAQGFNTKNSAIYNAINWVYSNSGLASMPSSAFIKMNNGNSPILIELSEEIDRFKGSCSIKESYVFDQAVIGSGILRYVGEVKTDKNTFNTISLKGSIDGGRYSSMGNLRSRYEQLDFYSIAAHLYRKSTSLNDLSAYPVTSGISEDFTKNTLNFEILFNNDNSPFIKVESRATIEKGNDLSNTQFTASLSSKISSRIGIKDKRYQDALSYFKNNFNPIQEFIKNMPNSILSYDLGNFRHVEDKVSLNQKEAFIEYNCTWSILPINRTIPCYIKSAQLSVMVTPKINEYNFIPTLCPNWTAFLKGYKWSSRSIQGQFNVYSGNERSALNWVKSSFGGGGTIVINTESISDGLVSFDYKYENIGG